jgi:hypothetical protein
MRECSLAGLAVGDPIVVSAQGRTSHRKVAKIARIWLTDDSGDKFRVTDGSGEDRQQFGHGFYAMTVDEWKIREETARLHSRLVDWGWVPGARGKSLTLSQMRRAVALVAEFEAENEEPYPGFPERYPSGADSQLTADGELP